MSEYNYRESKKRVEEILNAENNIDNDVDLIPKTDGTYKNGVSGWVATIFVDIRDSTNLFASGKKSSVAKIVRAFVSEVIEILDPDNNRIRDIGIRGDCVYAIYAISQQNRIKNKEEVVEVLNKAFYINTFMKMLNSLLTKRQMQQISVGIGLSINKDLRVKTGRVHSGVNDNVWIGKSVTYASKLSSMASKIICDYTPILMNSELYNDTIGMLIRNNPGKNVKSWYKTFYDENIGIYYGCDVVMSSFNKWIDEGMKNDE